MFIKEYKVQKSGALIQHLNRVEENFHDLDDILVERKQACEEEMDKVSPVDFGKFCLILFVYFYLVSFLFIFVFRFV